jgi:hypothetical protein
LAITAEQLLMSCQDHLRKGGKDNITQQTLLVSVKSSGDAASQLINLARGTSSGLERRERELDSAMLEISSYLSKSCQTSYCNDSNHIVLDDLTALPGARPEDVMQSCRQVTNGLSDLLFSNNQDDVVKAAKNVQEGVKTLLRSARGAANLSNDPKLQSKLISVAENVAR